MKKDLKLSRASEIKLKIVKAGKLSDCVKLPFSAKLLIDAYTAQCDLSGRSRIHFKIPDLPPSLNHQYVRYKNKVTGRAGQCLTKKAQSFRDVADIILRTKRHLFKNNGLMASVILLEGDCWITKDLRPKEADSDNMVKPVHDSLQVPFKFKDQEIWETFCCKCASNKNNVWVWLFDIGNDVQYYG